MLRLLQRDRVGMKDLDRVVSKLRAFYEKQRPTEKVTMWGRIKKLKISTDENFRQTEAFIGSTLSRPAFKAIRLYTENFYNRNAKLFDSRIREQWIRDCHGDLHLEHVHLAPKTLSIYDCIEFNDRFRYIDVASDIAFWRWTLTITVVRTCPGISSRGWQMLWAIAECWASWISINATALTCEAKSNAFDKARWMSPTRAERELGTS